jgi:hypothetical protein
MKRVASIPATHPFYAAWYNMRQRCYNPHHVSFSRYGGRGIYASASWENFELFRKDMWGTWKPGLELERRDNNWGYNKENCCWATRAEQCRNTSATKLSAEDVAEIRRLRGKVTQAELAKRYKVNSSHISRIQTSQKWS